MEWNGREWMKKAFCVISLSQPHRYLLIFFRKPTIRDSRGKSLSNYKLGTKDSFSLFSQKKKLNEMQKQSDQNGKLKLLRILWFFRNKKLFLAVLKTGLRNKY